MAAHNPKRKKTQRTLSRIAQISLTLCGIAIFGNLAMADENRTCHFPTIESMQGIQGVYQHSSSSYDEDSEKMWSTWQEEFNPFQIIELNEHDEEEQDIMQEVLRTLAQAKLRIETHCNGNHCTSKGYESNGVLRYEANCLNGQNHGRQVILNPDESEHTKSSGGYLILDVEMNYEHGRPNGAQRFVIEKHHQGNEYYENHNYTKDFTIQDGKLHGQYSASSSANIGAYYNSVDTNLTFHNGVAIGDFRFSTAMLAGLRSGGTSTQVGQYNSNGQIQGDLIAVYEGYAYEPTLFEHVSCHENTCQRVAQYGYFDYTGYTSLMSPHICHSWRDEALQLPYFINIGARYFQKDSSDFTPKGFSSLLGDFYNATSDTLNTTWLTFYHPMLSYCNFVDTLSSDYMALRDTSIKNITQAMQLLPKVKLYSKTSRSLAQLEELYDNLRTIKHELLGKNTTIEGLYENLLSIKNILLDRPKTHEDSVYYFE